MITGILLLWGYLIIKGEMTWRMWAASLIAIAIRGGRENQMAEIRVKEGESLDSALRRFKRNCAKAGIQQEIRKREHYEKPSVKRKKKSEAARKRKYN